MKLTKILKNNKLGFSLVEVVIGLGLMSVVILGVMQLQKEEVVGQKRGSANAEINLIASLVSQELKSQYTCKDALAGINFGSADDLTLIRPVGEFSPPEKFRGQNNIELISFKLKGIGAATHEPDGNLKRSYHFYITYKESNPILKGNRTLQKILPFPISVIYDGDGNVQKCQNPMDSLLKLAREKFCESINGDWDEGDGRCNIKNPTTNSQYEAISAKTFHDYVETDLASKFLPYNGGALDRDLATNFGISSPLGPSANNQAVRKKEVISKLACEPGKVGFHINGGLVCFRVSDVQTGKLACPVGKYFKGFDEGAGVICADLVSGCPGGNLTVDGSGNLVCPAADTQTSYTCRATGGWNTLGMTRSAPGADGLECFSALSVSGTTVWCRNQPNASLCPMVLSCNIGTVTSNSIGITSAVINWSGASDATSFDLSLKSSSDGGVTWTNAGSYSVSSSIHSYTFSGLDPNTDYRATVKPNCSTTTGSVDFKTQALLIPDPVFNGQKYRCHHGFWTLSGAGQACTVKDYACDDPCVAGGPLCLLAIEGGTACCDHTPTGACSADSGPSLPPDGGGGGCFVAGSKVTTSDRREINIEDILVGDKLRTTDGKVNVVQKRLIIDYKGPIYGINGETPFFTPNHPIKTTNGWKSLRPDLTRKEVPSLEVSKLKLGDTVVKDSGLEIIMSFTSEYTEEKVYNFELDGDHEFIVNELGVHNKQLCTGLCNGTNQCVISLQPNSACAGGYKEICGDSRFQPCI